MEGIQPADTGDGGDNRPDDTPPPVPLADSKFIGGAYLAVVLASVAAVRIAGRDEITVEIVEGFGALAVIYIIAQAIERFLEPIASTALLGADDLQRKKAEVAAGAEADASLEEKARAKVARLEVEQLQADRKVALWGAATVLALILSAVLELGLIDAIADVKDDNRATPSWFESLDVLITGLAIGAGTKPLHDLVSRIESAKKNADPATKPAVG